MKLTLAVFFIISMHTFAQEMHSYEKLNEISSGKSKSVCTSKEACAEVSPMDIQQIEAGSTHGGVTGSPGGTIGGEDGLYGTTRGGIGSVGGYGYAGGYGYGGGLGFAPMGFDPQLQGCEMSIDQTSISCPTKVYKLANDVSEIEVIKNFKESLEKDKTFKQLGTKKE